VRQRTAYSFEQKRVRRVLQHAAVSLLLDVLEVFARSAAGRIFLAHIAQPAGKFGEPFTIAAVAEPVDRQMSGLAENRAREDCNAWFSENHGGRS
jgi:hypothetical protein